MPTAVAAIVRFCGLIILPTTPPVVLAATTESGPTRLSPPQLATAARLYVEAASQAQTLAERNHLTLRAATLRHRLSGEGG